MAACTLQTNDTVQNAANVDSPIRIDWAACHSESQNTSDEIGSTQRDVFKTPPPKTVTDSNLNMKKALAILDGSNAPGGRRVYDIPSLLRCRGSLAGIGVFAKIKPEALSENLFQYMGANRPPQVVARSRGLSELSNPSRGSISSYNPSYPTIQPRTTSLPYGQSLAAPESSAFQQHEGFARFLKQHASPPHHRVTAGGRIVPAGPLSPPPMFDYASLTGMVHPRPGKPQQPTIRQLGSTSNIIREAVDQGKPLIGFHDPVLSLNSFPADDSLSQRQDGCFLAPTDPGMQLSMSLIPIGTFEDGTTIASYNGSVCRTYWNGTGTVIEPLYNNSAQISTGTQTELGNRPSLQMRQPSESSSLQSREQRNPLANTTNRPRISSSQSQPPSEMKDMKSQHIQLSKTLRNLDKHLALHHYDLGQEERAALIAQRKKLVKEIDNIRRITDPSSQDLPLVDIKVLASNTKTRSRLSALHLNSNDTDNKAKGSTLKVPIDNTTKKALSPAAPPFVPGRMTLPSLQGIDNKDLPTTFDLKIHSSSNLSGLRKHISATSASYGKGQENLRVQDESLDRDPIDPAMRVVHNSDIKYAAKFKLNQVEGRKQYCTLTSEFQEALRQVRQHARLYGCAGGSSKDPAYDAEQDIWWAVCDEDPIPLPPQTPDYVSNPRPWDWSDSFFNYRRVVAPSARKEPFLNAPKNTNGRNSFHRLGESSSDMPLHQKIRANGFDKSSEEIGTNREMVGGTVSANLDQEYMAVQKAINALNKRSQAIMAQAKNLSSINLIESSQSRANQSISDIHLASQDRTKDALLQQARVKNNSQTIQSDNHISSNQGIHNVTISNQGNRKASDITSESLIQDNTDLPNSLRLRLGSTSQDTSQGMVPVPKRESNTSKPSRGFPLHTQRASISKSQLEKSGILSIYEDSKSDLTTSNAGAKSSLQSSQNRNQRDLFARTKQQLSPRKAAKKAMEFYEKKKFKMPQKTQGQSILSSTLSAPRVNLPTLTNSQLKERSTSVETSEDSNAPQSTSTSFHSSEVKAIAVTDPLNDTFLRDMLKGPRYSTIQPFSKTSQHKTNIKPNKDIAVKDTFLDMEANKENATAEPHSAKVLYDSLSNHNRLSSTDRSQALVGKAPSSLAASAYHANGYLPQYDGAGKAKTSTVHQQHGVPVAHRQAKVNLPQRSSYDNQPSSQDTRSYPASSNSHPSSYNRDADWRSISFGLDGSGDAPSKSENTLPTSDNNSSEWKGKQKGFDTKGVTKADFDLQRADPHNPEHHSKVTGLFNKIAEEEAAYMATRKRQNTKTE